MEFLKIIILASIQGFAEFLPISSSGHLAVIGKLFGFDPESNLSLGVMLHAGTLCSILIFYFPKLLDFLRKPYRFHAILLVFLGSIPAGLAGVTLKLAGEAESIFSSFWVVGFGFLLTGTVLQIGRRTAKTAGDGFDVDRAPWKTAIVVGLAQMCAIFPGISRSGSTINMGLKCRLNARSAAEYSFLLAIPAIGGAGFLEAVKLFQNSEELTNGDLSMLASGFLVSAAVGYASLRILIVLLEKAKFHYFSWYLWALGLAVLLMACMGF